MDRVAQIPELDSTVKNWSFGKNFNKRADTYTYMYVADFDSPETLETFQASRTHSGFVATQWDDAISKRAFVSIHLD